MVTVCGRYYVEDLNPPPPPPHHYLLDFAAGGFHGLNTVGYIWFRNKLLCIDLSCSCFVEVYQNVIKITFLMFT